MTSAGFFTEGLYSSIGLIHTNLECGILDIRLTELSAKESSPCLEVSSSYQETDFIGGSAQVHHRILEHHRQRKELLALCTVEHRRGLESLLLQGVEDFHSCHGTNSQ